MENPDITLVGTGVKSATLGIFLKELMPNCTINIYESLDQPAKESSSAWNNAGTGHSAFCELNYTPQNQDGSVDVKKAIKIAEQFEVTRQFWSYLVSEKKIISPKKFIHAIPHLSFVFGQENVDFLKSRFDNLKQNPLFADMEFSNDVDFLQKQIPLVMDNRNPSEEIAATYMKHGTDVDFGILSKSMIDYLVQLEGVSIQYNNKVKKLKQKEDTSWRIKIENLATNETFKINSKFVFIGAGGGSLLLLEKANIEEAEGYGGFPVSGQWLKCNNPEIIAKHHTKVYGKAAVGAPPMSVPHLDTRIIDGKKELLFGPFAGFTTKFLKKGSYLDLIKSIEIDNFIPLISAGYHNIPLTKYLIAQVMLSHKDRVEALREYFPNAKAVDWELLQAGQRVQIIKKNEKEGGILEFGTEIISSKDGTIACLLGASPGASTAVSIMIDLIAKCFKTKFETPETQSKLKKIIPSFGQKLNENSVLLSEIRAKTTSVLKLNIKND